MKRIIRISILFWLILFNLDLNGQYVFLLEATSKSENKSYYNIYGISAYLYKYGIGSRYDITEYFNIGSKMNYIKFREQVITDFSQILAGGRGIERGNLGGLLISKFYSLNFNLKYQMYGFFTEIGFGIGRSTLKIDWTYKYTDYKEIDIEQTFTDFYERILTEDISLRLGYSYTYKEIISLGVYWERLKYYGKARYLESREGIYKPVEKFSPRVESPNPAIVNPNCYLWGVLIEYHFPKKNKYGK